MSFKECPICGKYTVTYDYYHSIERCMATFCKYEVPKKENKFNNIKKGLTDEEKIFN